jgi:hypothetical protein
MSRLPVQLLREKDMGTEDELNWIWLDMEYN